MKIVFAVLLSFIAVCLNGQQQKEFEGIIRYKHTFLFQSKKPDSTVINELGTSSVLYYKNGNYRWDITSIKRQTEYFDHKTQTVYYKFRNKDSLFRSKKNGFNDSLVSFKPLSRKETICGRRCTIVETVGIGKEKGDASFKRTLSYSPTVPIDSNTFYAYRSFASNKVIKRIKSWPLKIILESPDVDFVFILEATEIKSMKLKDDQVRLPANLPVKNLYLH